MNYSSVPANSRGLYSEFRSSLAPFVRENAGVTVTTLLVLVGMSVLFGRQVLPRGDTRQRGSGVFKAVLQVSRHTPSVGHLAGIWIGAVDYLHEIL